YHVDPYVVTRDAAIATAAVATFGIDDDDDDTVPLESQPYEPRGSLCDTQKSTKGNPPPPLTQDIVNRMIHKSVEAAIRAERERERVQNEANHAKGSNVALIAQECTFADFMKCSPITFRGNEGAVGLDPYVVTRDAAIATAAVATFGIDDDDDDDTAPLEICTNDCNSMRHIFVEQMQPSMPPRKSTRGNPPPPLTQDTECTFADFMKCSPITFHGNEGAVATMGIKAVTRKMWAEMKVEAYIRGLLENIKREVTSSEPATLNKAVRMTHTLMEQKVKAIAEREADNKKRKWENFQGGSSSGGGNNNSNQNNNYPKNPTGANAQLIVTCYGCGEKGHIKTNFPTRNNPGRNGARGQAYALRDGDQNLRPN
nr:hypothetical protein [Tanacetum cinerariifolium]